MGKSLISKLALGIAAFAPLARMAMYKGPMATPVEPAPTGILDMHCHMAGIGSGDSGAWISPEMQKSWKFPLYLYIFETSAKELKEKGDQVLAEIIAKRIRESKHVDGAVILAMDAPYDSQGQMNLDAGEVFVPNRFIANSVRHIPELHYGASVHPHREDALEEIQWSKDNGAVLMKWLPNIQDIDPSDERFVPYYKALVEADLPLLTHVGAEDSFSKANDSLGDPRLLKLPLELGVRVIAAHVGSSGESQGQDNVERLLEMMPHYPNLVADISTLTQMNRAKHLPKILNDPRLKGRLMYGTDHPLTNTPMVTPLQFPLRLTFEQMWKLWTTRNPWDRDVKLKAALGVPNEVFHMSREYLGL